MTLGLVLRISCIPPKRDRKRRLLWWPTFLTQVPKTYAGRLSLTSWCGIVVGVTAILVGTPAGLAKPLTSTFQTPYGISDNESIGYAGSDASREWFIAPSGIVEVGQDQSGLGAALLPVNAIQATTRSLDPGILQ